MLQESERPDGQEGGGGSPLEAAVNFYEKRVPHRGSLEEFLTLDAITGLTSRDKRTIQAPTVALSEFADRLISAMPSPFYERPNDFENRLRTTIHTFTQEKEEKAVGLLTYLLSTEPVVRDLNDLFVSQEESGFKEMHRDFSCATILAYGFGRDTLMNSLTTLTEQFESQNNDFIVTATRRILDALEHITPSWDKQRSHIDVLEQEKARHVLVPLLRADIPQSDKDSTAAILVNTTSPDEPYHLPIGVWWRALGVTDSDVQERAMEWMTELLKTDPRGAATSIVEELSHQQFRHGDSSSLYYFVEKILPRFDSLDEQAATALFHGYLDTLTRELESASVEYVDDTCVSSVCNTLDFILHLPQNADTQQALIDEGRAEEVSRDLLYFYLLLEVNANTWSDRTRILTLVEGLVSVYPELARKKSIHDAIKVVATQPAKDYDRMFPARLSEKEAAQSLAQLADVLFKEN